MEALGCRDPAWMMTGTREGGTFYPAATECYRDPSQATCFFFGNSGSGVVRKFKHENEQEERFAFTGPLSMSKSCDSIYIFDEQITYSSENPGVFTDAYCYLPWIAGEYGMKLPESYTTKDTCSLTIGERDNIDKKVCFGQDTENLNRGRCLPCKDNPEEYYKCQIGLENIGAMEPLSDNHTCKSTGTAKQTKLLELQLLETGGQVARCDFERFTYTKDGETKVWDQCLLEAQEGYAYNIYICKVSFKHLTIFPLNINCVACRTVMATI